MPRGRKKGSKNKRTLEVLLEAEHKLMQGRGIAPLTASDLLAIMHEGEMWLECKRIALSTNDGRLLLAILTYLTDRRDGRAPENIHIEADVHHHSDVDLARARMIAQELLMLTKPDAPIIIGTSADVTTDK